MKNNNPFWLKAIGFSHNISIATPIVPLYFLAKGVPLSTLLFGQVFYSAVSILSEVPTGILADKMGHRKSIFYGAIVAFLVSLAYIFVPNVWGYFIGMSIAGVSEAFLSGSSEALLYDSLEDKEKPKYQKHFGQVLSNGTIAFSVGTAFVGLMLGLWDSSIYLTLLIVSAATKLLTIVFSSRLVDPPAHKNLKPSDSKMWQSFKESLRFIKKDKTIFNLTLSKVLTLPAPYIIFGVYGVYFMDNGVDAVWIGLVLTIGSFINGLLMRQMHRVEKYLSLDKVILYFNIAIAATFFAFSVVTSPVALVVLYILLQAQFRLQDPIVSDYLNERIEPANRATILSGIALIRQIGNVTSKVILSFAVAGVGITGMLKVQAVYLLLGSLLTYWLLVRCGCVYKLDKSSSQ